MRVKYKLQTGQADIRESIQTNVWLWFKQSAMKNLLLLARLVNFGLDQRPNRGKRAVTSCNPS